MTTGIAPVSAFEHSSLNVAGQLPNGATALWAQSLTDLVCGMRRDGREGCMQDHEGGVLDAARLDAAYTALVAAGVEAGHVVLVEAASTLTSIAAILSLWQKGCVVCPIDRDCTPGVRAIIAHEADARAIIDTDGKVSLLGEPRTRPVIRLLRPKRVTGVDLALMVFTSGTSGKSKGVVLTHHNVMSALRAIATYLGITEQDRILAIPPLFFDYGLYQLLLSLFTGCALVVANDNHSVNKLALVIESMQPTVLPMVPALTSGIGRMLQIRKKRVPSVRLITNTGGHLPEASIALLQSVFPNTSVIPMYGLTECKRALYCDRSRFPDASGSVGVAMAGLDARVVIEVEGGGFREAEPDEIGELWVRGSSVMQEYRGADSGAGARLLPGRYRSDNWLATGDLFCIDAGGLHYFKGRSKSLIKQGGYCLIPRDIEELAESLALVEMAVVIGRTEDCGDERAVLYVQIRGESDLTCRNRVRDELRSVIPRTLMPREIVFVTRWPATANGKIDRRALEQRVEGDEQ